MWTACHTVPACRASRLVCLPLLHSALAQKDWPLLAGSACRMAWTCDRRRTDYVRAHTPLQNRGLLRTQEGCGGQHARPLLPAAEAALRHPALLQRYLRPAGSPEHPAAAPGACAAAADAATTDLLAWLLSHTPGPKGHGVSHQLRGSGRGVQGGGAAGSSPAAAAGDEGRALAMLCTPYLQRCAQAVFRLAEPRR